MKAWNMDSKNVRAPEINQFITLYKKRIFGIITPTRRAPSRYALELFGGSISIEEFRRGLTNKWISMPNINFHHLIINKYEQITKIDKRKQSVIMPHEMSMKLQQMMASVKAYF